MSAGNRVLYVCSSKGLLEVAPRGERHEATPLGNRTLENASAMVQDARDPSRLYVATLGHGVLRSTDGGATFAPASAGLGRRKVWCLAQHPRTLELYAGTEPSAVYKSRDGGDRFTECEGVRALPRAAEWAFPTSHFEHHVKRLTLDPQDANVVYGAVEEGWLIRSVDGGATWENLTRGVSFDAHDVALVRGDRGRILASSGEGFFVSKDGGASFAARTEGLDRRYLSPIAVHLDRPAVVVVCGSKHTPDRWFAPGGDGADSAFYRSDDGGETFARVPGVPALRGGAWAAAVDPDDPGFFAIGLHDGSLWLSDDGARSFRLAAEGLGTIGSVVVGGAASRSAAKIPREGREGREDRMAKASGGPLAGRVALVTGASRGIGAAIARRLAEQGAAVAVNYCSSEGAASEVVATIVRAGGRAIAVRADVGDPAALESMERDVAAALGPVDTLVLNASAAKDFVVQPFMGMGTAAFEAMLLGEVRGVWLPSKVFAPGMIERGRGCIVAVSSGSSRFAVPGMSAHGAGKAACDALVRSMATELGPFGVRVNAVAPGLTETEGAADQVESLGARLARQTPMQRLARAEDVAGAVSMLVSDDAGFVTGAYVPVSGGLQMV